MKVIAPNEANIIDIVFAFNEDEPIEMSIHSPMTLHINIPGCNMFSLCLVRALFCLYFI